MRSISNVAALGAWIVLGVGTLMLLVGGVRLLLWAVSPLASRTPVSQAGLALTELGAATAWFGVLMVVLVFSLRRDPKPVPPA